MTTNVINKGWFNPISLSVFLILVIVSAVLYVSQIVNIPVFILLLLLSGLAASAIRIADQWERAVVLRMGKYSGLKGPGPFMIIPVIDSVSTYIDQRVRVSAFKAEHFTFGLGLFAHCFGQVLRNSDIFDTDSLACDAPWIRISV